MFIILISFYNLSFSLPQVKFDLHYSCNCDETRYTGPNCNAIPTNPLIYAGTAAFFVLALALATVGRQSYRQWQQARAPYSFTQILFELENDGMVTSHTATSVYTTHRAQLTQAQRRGRSRAVLAWLPWGQKRAPAGFVSAQNDSSDDEMLELLPTSAFSQPPTVGTTPASPVAEKRIPNLGTRERDADGAESNGPVRIERINMSLAEPHEIDASSLVMLRELGSGAAGVVHEALYHQRTVLTGSKRKSQPCICVRPATSCLRNRKHRAQTPEVALSDVILPFLFNVQARSTPPKLQSSLRNATRSASTAPRCCAKPQWQRNSTTPTSLHCLALSPETTGAISCSSSATGAPCTTCCEARPCIRAWISSPRFRPVKHKSYHRSLSSEWRQKA